MSKSGYVKGFEKLLEEGCDEGAAGLLCDLFRMLRYAEVGWPQVVQPQLRKTDQQIRENRLVALREVLREILDDPDGSQLNDWHQLYCEGEPAFREHARQHPRQLCYTHDSGLVFAGGAVIVHWPS